MSGAARHLWVKVKVHCCLCRTCGLCRQNGQRANGDWFVTWHLPTGESHDRRATPVCQVGSLTAKRLKHYEAAIVVADVERANA
jgi:hypothetical protein